MPPDHPHPLPSSTTSLAAFTPLERTVVALGLRDPLWSVPRPRPHPRLWFRGDHPDAARMSLANERLEQLRRFIVALRHDDVIQDPHSLIDAGFTAIQIHEATAIVRAHRDA